MEGYIGEIRMFGGNFAPRSWAFCEGQLLSIAQNTALFSILGTIYGGDGRTTFALPDLRGRTPLSEGTGPGIQHVNLGQRGGQEYYNMNILQLAGHSHFATKSEGTFHLKVADVTSDENSPVDNNLTEVSPDNFYASSGGTEDYGPILSQVTASAGNTGASQNIEIMQPYIACYYIICLQGIFPSRS